MDKIEQEIEHIISISNEPWKDFICKKCHISKTFNKDCEEYCLPLEMMIRLMSTPNNQIIEKINNLRIQAINL